MRNGWHALLMLFACLGVAPPAVAGSAASLRAGQYWWSEQPALIRASTAPSRIRITVSIADQRAYVYRDGTLIGVTTVSTGTKGRETPLGAFTILQKQVFHRSNLYSNAPMPFMQRLTWSGVAMHAGHLPGYPASHGCIRMPRAFAEQLYGMTELGVAVQVVAGHVDAAMPLMAQPLVVASKAAPRIKPMPVEEVEVDLAPIPYPSPMLLVDTGALRGDAFEVVTMPGDGPAEPQPVAWRQGAK